MEKKSCNANVAVLTIATMALAAMGCWFCWHCPSRIYPPGAHDLFWRQLAWNGVGLAVFAATWLMGWRRLLKAAPWLMAAWLVAIAAAHFSRPVNGAHKWLPVGPVHVNVVTCFMPVFALFLAWLHDKKWIRPWMEWSVVVVAVSWCWWHVAENGGRQERIIAFLSQGDRMPDRVYMARQLLAAFDVSKWFGEAGRSLGFLPCPESDGMMSASAMIFGKWFPASLVGLFASLGAYMTLIWKGAVDVAKRRFALLFGLWLIAPAAYCLLHSLAFLPVAGMSPALAGYGGTAVVMAWFGVGVLAAMSRSLLADGSVAANAVPVRRVCATWGAMAGVAVLLIAFAPKRGFLTPGGDLKFAEPRPSDMEFGEFGLIAKRGRILAADGSPLAYTVRKWRFYLDPVVAKFHGFDIQALSCEIANGLELEYGEVASSFSRKSRYVFLVECGEDDAANSWFESHRWLTRFAGIIREPVQKRIYPLGEAATAAVGFMYGGAHADTPQGAGGLEWAFNRELAGTNGIYDAKLPLDERVKRATPASGADIRATIVPAVQKAVSGFLAAACATNGAESAFAIVMKVPSGEIAAMSSWPSFDPSMRRDLDKWDGSMAVNRPAQVLFEPGGLVKPLTYAIALDLGILAEDAKIDQENGAWEYNGETFRDETTNSVTIAEAIECRVNIAAGKTACLIGLEKFHAALRRLGFGSKTGVAGISGEEVGILASKPERWDKTTAMRVGMGYGFAATGLQIAQAYATLANHGTLVRPVLVKTAATNATVQVVSPSSADAIMRMLKSPMPSTVQMCERDRKAEQTVYSPTNYIASCTGFVPVDKPEYVVVVSFSKPRPAHAGDEVAKPVFQSIADSL